MIYVLMILSPHLGNLLKVPMPLSEAEGWTLDTQILHSTYSTKEWKLQNPCCIGNLPLTRPAASPPMGAREWILRLLLPSPPSGERVRGVGGVGGGCGNDA